MNKIYKTILIALFFWILLSLEGSLIKLLQIVHVSNIQKYFDILSVHPSVGFFGVLYIFVFVFGFFLVKEKIDKSIIQSKFFFLLLSLIVLGVVFIILSTLVFHYASFYATHWETQIKVIQDIRGFILSFLGLFLISSSFILLFFYFLREFLKQKPKIKTFFSLLGVGSNLPLSVVAFFHGLLHTLFASVVIVTSSFFALKFAFLGDFNSLSNFPLLKNDTIWWSVAMVKDSPFILYSVAIWLYFVKEEKVLSFLIRGMLFVEFCVLVAIYGMHINLLTIALPQDLIIIASDALLQMLVLIALIKYLNSLDSIKTYHKFLLLSIFGFVLEGILGAISGTPNLAAILRSSEWVIGSHTHIAVLLNLMPAIFAFLYYRFDLEKSSFKNIHFYTYLIGSVGLTISMGLAGLGGVLRRHLYLFGEYFSYSAFGAVFGGSLLISSIIFLIVFKEKNR